MSTTRLLLFSYPEPRPAKIRLLPFFLPFAGCAQRCIFCNQHVQTGKNAVPWETVLHDLRQTLASQQAPFGLGFFGGTFTGLPRAWQRQFLDLANEFRGQGLAHLRISTRPDRVNAQNLNWLARQGVDMVELGIQSFQAEVLQASKRGYTARVAAQACKLVQATGLDLGIQLLPGLPKHTQQHWQLDVEETVALRPAVTRVYPCVVMAGTELAKDFARGQYLPWALEETVRACAWALRCFWEAGIRVIRLGLAHETSFEANLLAGPWHPALGNMIRAQTLCAFLEEKLASLTVRGFFLPQRLQGELWGYKQANAPRLEQLGINKKNLRTWTNPEIGVEVEK